MPVIWLNGTVGSGKTAVGAALADLLPGSRFLDGDDFAGPARLANPIRWRMALDALLQAVARPGACRWTIIAYPLERSGYRRLRAACGKARRRSVIVNLDTPLCMTLRGRGGRTLSVAEAQRVRVMRSAGYHHRPFATATLRNAYPPVDRTARQIRHLARIALAA